MDTKTLQRVQKLPDLFIEKVLGCYSMQSYHLDICTAVSTYDRVAISACHAVGKTWILARIVLWFLYSFPHSIIITTAPTNRQVEKLLWGEIGVAVQGAPFNLGGHLTSKELKIDKKWYAMGFSPQKSAGNGDDSSEQKGSTFQGFHADFVLIVFDEATGIPPDIWVQVEGLLTSGKIVKFICIANPTTKNCDFYDCFSNPTWFKMYLSCFDSPNLKANNINDLNDIKRERDILTGLDEGERLARIKDYLKPVTYLISCQWVMEKALEWGVDDARFKAKVLGIFPDVDDTVLIQEGDVRIAQARTQLAKPDGVRYIGIDVARFGDDKSVWTELVEAEKKKEAFKNKDKYCDIGTGPVHTRTKKTAKQDLMATTGVSVRFIMDDWDDKVLTIVGIDATGVGSGVFDRLMELQKEKELPPKSKLRFIELHYGASVKGIQKNKKKPTKKELLEQKSYLNIKALMFDDLKNALKDDMRLRKDSTYNTQLPTIKYQFNSNGKMQIESKKDYKKRTGKPSPDEADSLAMANFMRRFKSYADNLKKMVR